MLGNPDGAVPTVLHRNGMETALIDRYNPNPEHAWAAQGHVFTVDDPLRMLSVLEPQRPGGCSQREDIREDFRVPVQETAVARNCSVAINAGFFNVNDGKCYGNLVSDGYVVQTGPANVNFGIRKSGKIEVGYINASEVEENDRAEDPFLQLVAGVLWLVRDGKAYVNTSMQLEYPSTQGGTLSQFRAFKSARVAIGHDKNGVVKVVQIDGKTWDRGLNLDDFVELLLGMGLVNAINLDGGGSSTSVVNGSVVSASSEDACKDKFPCTDCNEDIQQLKYYCERPVTTIICLKEAAPFTSSPPSSDAAAESAGLGKLRSRLLFMESAAESMTTGMIVLVAVCIFSLIFNVVQCCCDISWICPCSGSGCCQPSWLPLDDSRELLVHNGGGARRGRGSNGKRGRNPKKWHARSTPLMTSNPAFDALDYDVPTDDFGGDSLIDGTGTWHEVNA